MRHKATDKSDKMKGCCIMAFDKCNVIKLSKMMAADDPIISLMLCVKYTVYLN
jgi:hypothetical protein